MFSLLFSLSVLFQNSGNLPPASSVISALPSRNVGMGTYGRLGPIAVYEKDTDIFYVGSCNGGVLKTTDGGDQFQFVFDKQGSANIGALAISQKNPNVVWVGTGDQAMRLGVGRGDGVYKSLDGGKTWQHMGLKKSHTIGKILIDPRNDDVVFVAALGDTWGYNEDRGIYKTKDGGKTWKKVLYLDEKSSGNDVIQDPKNPNNLLASLWDKVHKPYGWYEWGPGSGIYRSTDNGETWKKVTAGLPTEKVGRICMDYCRKDPNYVAAIIEEPAPLSRTFTSKDGGKTWQRRKAVHMGYDKKVVKDNLDKEGQPVWYRTYYNHVIAYDPNDINTFYYGTFGHVTKDGGDTWVGGASDTHGLWIDPKDSNHKLEANDNGVKFVGKHGKALITPPVTQSYGVGFDMRKLYWVHSNNQDHGGKIGPTQTIYGEVTPFDTAGGCGDEAGKTMGDPSNWAIWYAFGRDLSFARWNVLTGEVTGASPAAPDKFHIYNNPKESEAYFKQERRLRCNWNPGCAISPWDAHTIYYGGNYLFRSKDAGDHWETISPDLTHNNLEFQKPDDGPSYHGDPSESREYQTIYAVAESPLKRGMIWVGTDCGYVQLTKDDGKTWDNVTKNIPGIPDYCWVSRVAPSRFSAGRCYVTFDNHKNNDMKTYVFVTEDYGKTWTKITGNLPKEECCYSFQEGMKNPDLLYLGTEYGLWISLDRGRTWDKYQDYKEKNPYNGWQYDFNYFPTVTIWDIEIHPRELDVILGAHGRGVWILPGRALEEMTAENRAKDVYFCSPGNVYLFPTMQRDPFPQYAPQGYSVRNSQPGTLFSVYLKNAAKSAKITITKAGGEPFDAINEWGTVRVPVIEIHVPTTPGLNSVHWGVDRKCITEPGDYRATLNVDGKEYVRTLHVEDANDEVVPVGKHQVNLGDPNVVKRMKRHDFDREDDQDRD